jgi:hypothetical protein
MSADVHVFTELQNIRRHKNAYNMVIPGRKLISAASGLHVEGKILHPLI